MAELNYTTRSIRRRRNTDMWEISLSHTNPITGEQIRTYHTVEAKTKKQAERSAPACCSSPVRPSPSRSAWP